MFEDLSKGRQEHFADKLHHWGDPLDLDLLRTAIADARGIPYTQYDTPETRDATLAYLLPLLTAGKLKAGRIIPLRRFGGKQPAKGTKIFEDLEGTPEEIIAAIGREWNEKKTESERTIFECQDINFTLPENPWPTSGGPIPE